MAQTDERSGPAPEHELETRTVFFCEQTNNGELARRLREVERRLTRITGFKTKIIDGVGSKLQHLQPNSNPWAGAHFGRGDCVPCGQGGERLQNCTKRNIIYESKWIDCNPIGQKADWP